MGSFSYFPPTIPNTHHKTCGTTGIDLTQIDQNIVPIEHDCHCIGLEGTGNNSNQWKCIYAVGVQATSVTVSGTQLCWAAGPSTNQQLIWTGSAFAWCDTTSGYNTAAFNTDFGTKCTNDLSDITVSGVADGEVLTYNSTSSKWENASTATELPSQTGNSGCYLGTDGASASWDTLTKTTVGLSNVDNTTDAGKPISTSTQSALNLKAPLADPAFTGTPTGITKTHVGLGNIDNTADADKPVSTAAQTALDLKAPIASPTFTGTVAGVTATHVGLGNVDNTTDANKPVSTATQTALDLKAPLASPTFTGTVAGVTATHVGLGNVDNESKATMFTAPTFTGTALGTNLTLSGDLTVDGTTTTINSTTLSVDDKNIELGSVTTPTDATADGGGITLKGATDKTIIWDNANDNWTSNQDWNLDSGFDYKINNVVVLNSTTLQYLDATSSVQTQIDSKQATLTSGIADTNNVIVDSASVADDEYARFTASGLESRSTSEVLSDIGGQASLTSGIADTNNVVVDSASVADDEYARFTASGLESRSVSEVLSDIGAQGSLTSGIADTNNVVVDSASVADDEYARFTASGLESRSTSEVLSDIGALATSTASTTYAPLASPTFTGTPVTPILKLTPTATASAPAGTEGAMYYDSDLGSVMVHSGSAWNMISAGTASGGTETTYTGYKVHTFTGNGTFTISGGTMILDILIVAGGGGAGGRWHGAGGGAGGLREFTNHTLSAGTYSVTIGGGGAGGPASNTVGVVGNPSSIGGYAASGGGYGAAYNTGGGAGGSGGGDNGGGSADYSPGSGNVGGYSPVEGYAGQATPASGYHAGGGGGGAAEVGGTGGNATGGAGINNSWRTNSAVGYGGGGAGSTGYVAGTGGASHGGGAQDNAGSANTGGGGGAGSGSGSSGFTGGSGIVVIRYSA